MSSKSPEAIVKAACAIGSSKTRKSVSELFVSGFLAGAFIAFGGLLAILVGKAVNTETLGVGVARLVFAGVFPVGIMLVVIAGSELFTGNCGLIVPSCMKGSSRWSGLLKNWVVVYTGNFAGALAVAYFLGHLSGLVAHEPYLSATRAIAEAKVDLMFGQAFLRGVGCNWLVCLAVWLAIASDDTTGKIWGLWFPVMAFVAIGFEHSVANMFFIPLGMLNEANVTAFQFLVDNLLPVTLGNIVGGGVFVGLVYWWLYGRVRKPQPLPQAARAIPQPSAESGTRRAWARK